MQPLTITGTVDGTNATFTVTANPLPSPIRWFRNGGLLYKDLDYSAVFSATSVIITLFLVPQPGDSIEARG